MFRLVPFLSRRTCALFQNSILVKQSHEISSPRRQCTSSQSVSFDDHQKVFQEKSFQELLRALFVLRMSSVNAFVDRSLPLFRLGHRLMGTRGLSLFLRPTFYSQFVAGENEFDLEQEVQRMHRQGVRLMLCPALEEDVGEGGQSAKYANGLAAMKELARIVVRLEPQHPMLQLKVTSLMPADTLCEITTILRKLDSTQVAVAVQQVCDCMSGKALPTSFFDLTRAGREIFISSLHNLGRFANCIQKYPNIRLLVDAEYTYLQPGIGFIGLVLMAILNRDVPVVCNTYQCYLKAALETLHYERQTAEQLGVCFAAKIVRGAYLERERSLARLNNTPDPTNPDYQATGKTYEKVVADMLDYVQRKPMGKDGYVIVATNNEDSVRFATNLMTQQGMDPRSASVAFGQVYGMAEQVSVGLAESGYITYKSTPIGRLEIVLPYLARRAAESRGIFRGTRRERKLIRDELLKRMGMKQ